MSLQFGGEEHKPAYIWARRTNL